jgi:hypothetical protein
MGFEHVAAAGGAMELAPWSTIGIAISAQIAQADPAAILAGGLRTEVRGGIDLTRASIGQGHRCGWYGRKRCGMRSCLLAGGPLGLAGEPGKRFGSFGALQWWWGKRGVA